MITLPQARVVFGRLPVLFVLSLVLPLGLGWLPLAGQETPFRRGDVNADGGIDISDAIAGLDALFQSGLVADACIDASDVNDSGDVDVSDAVYLLLYLFANASPPPPPHPACGGDPTPDALDCAEFQICGGDLFELSTVAETSPYDGESGVAISRESFVVLSRPLAPHLSPDDLEFFAAFSGERIDGRVHISVDRMEVTLFYDALLPASAQVGVALLGDGLLDDLGRELDLDGDGAPGGDLVFAFETLGLTQFPGTIVCGRIFASEPAPAGEGVDGELVDVPLPGVRITVDGLETVLHAETDERGDFRLEDAPAGEFFVHIDGRFIAGSNWPDGDYYPVVGKSWTSIPGEEVNLPDIFLPLVVAGTLQEVMAGETTMITLPQSVIDADPDLAGVSIEVPPGALFDEAGNRGGRIGVAPVDPNRLPGPLPAGLDFSLVITVQTDGATNFDTPVSVCFPNDAGLAPGEKSALWSFNHDTGRFEIVGSMTVSADGQTVCSDPGQGIRAPGWHSSSQASPGGGGGTGSDQTNQQNTNHKASGAGGASAGCYPSPNMLSENPKVPADPVHPSSGEFYQQELDLRIKGVGFDFIWARHYRSRSDRTSNDGYSWDPRFGYGWDLSYNVFVERRGRSLVVHNGNARADEYPPVAGRSDQWGKNGRYHDLVKNEDESYTLTFANGGRWNFLPLDDAPEGGRLMTSVDRNGNTITLTYDGEGRLDVITDTLGRDIVVSYNADGRISGIEDFKGREVRYEYYGEGELGGNPGDLKSVTSPTVTNTPARERLPRGEDADVYLFDRLRRRDIESQLVDDYRWTPK